MKKFLLKFLTVTFALTLILGILSACGENPHTHNFNLLKFDATNHWYECSCGEKSDLEVHKGGTATETQKAKCSVCNEEYGSLLIPGHTHNCNKLKFDDIVHWYECECGINQNMEEHFGGTATETTKKVCEVCLQEYGDYEVHSHSFIKMVTTSNYLKEPATCKNKALYYYSCDCGEEGNATFEYGSLGNHDYKNGVCLKCNDILYKIEGTYIYFGKYPQTIKANNVSVSSFANENGYFIGSDGFEYAKVVANTYSNGYKFSTGASIEKGKEYYFKVEPIRWEIITENGNDMFLLCDMVIENKRYDDTFNNYKDSEVRAWLNNEFYTKAFSDLQKAMIETSIVDNSVASTGLSENSYVCEDTQDKIFLLSYANATNNSYGLSSDNYRKKISTDFARANKIYMDVDPRNYGYSSWWLRSPVNSDNSYVYQVFSNGRVDSVGDWVQNSHVGIVPALQIKLS